MSAEVEIEEMSKRGNSPNPTIAASSGPAASGAADKNQGIIPAFSKSSNRLIKLYSMP